MTTIRKYYTALAALILLASCTKNFTATNTNPTLLTSAPAQLEFNAILGAQPINYYEQLFYYNDFCYLASQLATSPNQGTYNLGNFRQGSDDLWGRYFGVLATVRDLQTKLSSAADTDLVRNQSAMLKIINAYLSFKMADTYGDFPYSQAGYAFSNSKQVLTPAYDTQQSIYLSLLNDLKWAVDSSTLSTQNAAGEAYLDFGSEEYVIMDNGLVTSANYMTKWREFANALRLRYAVRMSAKDPTDATATIQDVLASGILPPVGDDFGLFPATITNWTNDNINTAFRNDLSGTGLRMGSNLWSVMSDGLGNATADIVDPRVYIYFNQDGTGNWTPIPQSATSTVENGNPYTPTPGDNLNQLGTYATVSLNLSGRSPTHLIPQIFISSAEVQFLLAEIYARPDLGQQNLASAQTAYTAGVTQSMAFWYKTASEDPGWMSSYPAAPTTAQITAYLALPQFAFTPSTALTQIYKQRWLDLYWQPFEAFSLMRETGGLTPMQALSTSSPVVGINRMPYPTTEAQFNSVSYNAELSKLGGQDNTATKVWWQP